MSGVAQSELGIPKWLLANAALALLVVLDAVAFLLAISGIFDSTPDFIAETIQWTAMILGPVSIWLCLVFLRKVEDYFTHPGLRLFFALTNIGCVIFGLLSLVLWCLWIVVPDFHCC